MTFILTSSGPVIIGRKTEEVPPTLGSNPDKQRPKGPGQEQKRYRRGSLKMIQK